MIDMYENAYAQHLFFVEIILRGNAFYNFS